MRLFLSSLICVFISLVAQSTPAFADSEVARYRVQKGDQIGQILQFLKVGTIWGKDGYAAWTISKNQKNNSVIHPGDEVLIPLPENLPENALKEGDYVILLRHQETPVTPVKVHEAIKNTPAPVPSPTPPFLGALKLSAAFTSSFLRIDSVDKMNGGTGHLLTTTSPGFVLGYFMQPKEDFELGFVLSGNDFHFDQSSSKTIEQADQWLVTMGVVAKRKFGSNLKARVSLFFTETPFTKSTSADSVSVQSVSQPGAELGVEWKFLTLQKIDFNLNFFYQSEFGGSSNGVTAQFGNAYGLGPTLYRDFGSKQLQVGAFYRYLSQDSNLADQSLKELNLFIGLQFGFR